MNEATVQAELSGSNVLSPMEWKPSRTELLREYEIRIKFLSIGCLIEVGCKSIPFSTIKEGLDSLNEYIVNPYETRKLWEAKFAKDEQL